MEEEIKIRDFNPNFYNKIDSIGEYEDLNNKFIDIFNKNKIPFALTKESEYIPFFKSYYDNRIIYFFNYDAQKNGFEINTLILNAQTCENLFINDDTKYLFLLPHTIKVLENFNSDNGYVAFFCKNENTIYYKKIRWVVSYLKSISLEKKSMKYRKGVIINTIKKPGKKDERDMSYFIDQNLFENYCLFNVDFFKSKDYNPPEYLSDYSYYIDRIDKNSYITQLIKLKALLNKIKRVYV